MEKGSNMRDEIFSNGRNVFFRKRMQEAYEPGFEIKMIIRNEPKHLLKVHVTKEGKDTYLNYNITDLVSLSDCESGEKLQHMYGVISALARMADVSDDYMLLPKNLDLSPERIFIERETGEVYFCYNPENEGTVPENLRRLTEFFIKHANPVKEADVLLVYGLYRKCREEHITLRTPLEYWKNTRNEERKQEPVPEECRKTEGGYSPEVDFSAGHDRESQTQQIYDQLGLAITDEDSSFVEWKKKRKGSERVEYSSAREETMKKEEQKDKQENAPRKASGISKLRKLLLGKMPEIGIGIIAFAVSAALILCG